MDLASLLEERSEIDNTSGFASDTHNHIVDVIDAASRENGFYRSHLKDELKPPSRRYDLKYWPSLAEVVQVIGQDADDAGTRATNPLTRAATTGSRGSRADFFKAIAAADRVAGEIRWMMTGVSDLNDRAYSGSQQRIVPFFTFVMKAPASLARRHRCVRSCSTRWSRARRTGRRLAI